MHKEYLENLRYLRDHQLGFQYNFDFSFSRFSYLLDFFINNIGDTFIPSNYAIDSREYEKKVLEFFSKTWGFEDWWGYLTSSGTEGNLAGLLYGKLSLNNPVVYFSKDTHYSIEKGCMAYSLESEIVNSQPTGEIDYHHLENRIQKNRNRDIIFICNLSTTFRGAYDSAKKFLDIIDKNGISRERVYIHGDGALGGMMLPFLKDVDKNYKISGRIFDSISVSGHKMPGCPIPCGVIITQKNIVNKMNKEIEYLSSRDTTLNGSRNGLAAILLSHSLYDTSIEGWCDKVNKSIRNADYLYSSLLSNRVTAKLNRYSNLVVFEKPDISIINKWQLSCIGEEAKVAIMPHHTKETIDSFVSDVSVQHIMCKY